MPTFAQTQAGYTKMWNSAKLMDSKMSKIQSAVHKIMDSVHRSAYEQVEKLTGVPWFMIGALLYRESDSNLGTYIGNGQSLRMVTTEVPAGRGPFLTDPNGGVIEAFIHGCLDAFKLQGFLKFKRSDWTIEFCLYQAEEFNGEGYQKHNEDSPYVWAGTNYEEDGLFTSDHGYDPHAHDSRVGVAAIIAGIAMVDASILQLPNGSAQPQESQMPPISSPIGTAPVPGAPIPPHQSVMSLIDFNKIEKGVEAAAGTISTFSWLLPPQFKGIVAFVPLLEETLTFLGDLQTNDWSHGTMKQSLTKFLRTAADRIDAL